MGREGKPDHSAMWSVESIPNFARAGDLFNSSPLFASRLSLSGNRNAASRESRLQAVGCGEHRRDGFLSGCEAGNTLPTKAGTPYARRAAFPEAVCTKA